MIYEPVYKNPHKHIAAKEIAVAAGNSIQLHSDACVHLVCPQVGAFSAVTRQRSFILHPSQVFILPARLPCRLQCSVGVVQIVTISRSAFQDAKLVRTLTTSDLIKSLIREVVRFDDGSHDVAYENAILSLFLRELARRDTVSDQAAIEMPSDKRLRRVCEELLNEPAIPDSVDGWCRKAGMSRRNFTRVFKRETGVTFGAWRREVRLIAALSRIIGGEQVAMAAYDVGYESVSTFAAAFARRFGVSPCRYKPKMGRPLLQVGKPDCGDGRQPLPCA
jgi:AraC-like DNA-binding protein